MVDIGLLVVVFTSGAALGATAEAIYNDRRKPKTKVMMGVKKVDNRTMPDYSRAERRAYKKRRRG